VLSEFLEKIGQLVASGDTLHGEIERIVRQNRFPAIHVNITADLLLKDIKYNTKYLQYNISSSVLLDEINYIKSIILRKLDSSQLIELKRNCVQLYHDAVKTLASTKSTLQELINNISDNLAFKLGCTGLVEIENLEFDIVKSNLLINRQTFKDILNFINNAYDNILKFKDNPEELCEKILIKIQTFKKIEI